MTPCWLYAILLQTSNSQNQYVGIPRRPIRFLETISAHTHLLAIDIDQSQNNWNGMRIESKLEFLAYAINLADFRSYRYMRLFFFMSCEGCSEVPPGYVLCGRVLLCMALLQAEVIVVHLFHHHVNNAATPPLPRGCNGASPVFTSQEQIFGQQPVFQ